MPSFAGGVQYIYLKTKLSRAAAIVIAFNGKDLANSFGIIIAKQGKNVGNIYKPKGKDVCTYVISDLLLSSQFNKWIHENTLNSSIILINWISTKGKRPTFFNKLPLDNSPLDSNAWLSGFIDSDGCFTVRVSLNKNCKTKKISVMLALVQKTVSLNNHSLF